MVRVVVLDGCDREELGFGDAVGMSYYWLIFFAIIR